MGHCEWSDLAEGECKSWESLLKALHHKEEEELEGNPGRAWVEKK